MATEFEGGGMTEDAAAVLRAKWDADKKANLALPKEEFCRRFIVYMMEGFKPDECFQTEDGDDGQPIAEYSAEVAASYWEDESQRKEGPEECAAADMSYWGE